jgi:hypothetical protein
MKTTDSSTPTILSYTPVMAELNEAVADLDVQFVGIVGGEMKFNRITRVAEEDEVAPAAAVEGEPAPAAAVEGEPAPAATEGTRDSELLDLIIQRIGGNPTLVEQIKGVDSVSLRD